MQYVKPFDASDPNAPYVNGNPATGTPGSIPPAEAFEHPQREIMEVIQVMGNLTPNPNDLAQLRKAIQAYVDKLTPKGAKRTQAFTPNVAVADVSGIAASSTFTVVQSITVSGATYLDLTGYVAFANTQTTMVSVTGRFRVLDGATIVADSQYLGCTTKDNFQIPISLRAAFNGLNPAKTYTVQILAQKGAAIGPVQVYDPFILALHDGA